MPAMKVNLVTPEERLFNDEASFVVVPGAEGVLGFLYSHAPVMTTLAGGEVKIEYGEDKKTEHFAVQGGFVGADGHRVMILATRASLLANEDSGDVKSRIDDLEGRLKTLSEDAAERAFLEAELSWEHLLEKLLSKTS
ncbi:MAG: ATP synthase F1 subunit epsilon [Actinomycetia bacterium]|nr:ATP synthase F1 subunit epsilon [Actinomycetes bacterium]